MAIDINIEEVQNTIFEGAAAASCRLQLNTQPDDKLLEALRTGNPDIIGLEVLRIGDESPATRCGST